MLRLIILGVVVTSCSMGVTKKGGNDPYVYLPSEEYTEGMLKELAPKVVTTLKRDPKSGSFKDLFSNKQSPIKRVGVVIFESMIQNSLTGLATEDRVYLSDQGKQLLTEKLLSVWEQSFPIVLLTLITSRRLK